MFRKKRSSSIKSSSAREAPERVLPDKLRGLNSCFSGRSPQAQHHRGGPCGQRSRLFTHLGLGHDRPGSDSLRFAEARWQ